MHFCGINFCDWQNLEDFAELIFADDMPQRKKITEFFYVNGHNSTIF